MLGTLASRVVVKLIALKSTDLSVLSPRLMTRVRVAARIKFVAAWRAVAHVASLGVRTIRRTRRPLILVAFTLVGCSNQLLPAATPTIPTTTLRIYATTPAIPLLEALTQAYSAANPAARFEIASGGFESVLARIERGDAPYFFTNHLPPDAEARGLWAAPIGQDGIAVIIHPNNALRGLSSEQLRAIFQGRVANWRELGGMDAEIVVFSREDGSGTRAEFESLIMGERRTTRSAQIAPSSAAMRTSVARTPSGIGYISTSYLDSTVRALSIDGIAPTLEHVTANAYPLRSTLFIVGEREPEANYRAFIAWVQSPAGQAVVARHYAPLG
jgi:phosphate transport system substrate-binding protein